MQGLTKASLAAMVTNSFFSVGTSHVPSINSPLFSSWVASSLAITTVSFCGTNDTREARACFFGGVFLCAVHGFLVSAIENQAHYGIFESLFLSTGILTLFLAALEIYFSENQNNQRTSGNHSTKETAKVKVITKKEIEPVLKDLGIYKRFDKIDQKLNTLLPEKVPGCAQP